MLAEDGKRKVRGLYAKSVSHFFVGIPSQPENVVSRGFIESIQCVSMIHLCTVVDNLIRPSSGQTAGLRREIRRRPIYTKL